MGQRIVFVLGDSGYYERFGSASEAAGFVCVYACEAFQTVLMGAHSSLVPSTSRFCQVATCVGCTPNRLASCAGEPPANAFTPAPRATRFRAMIVEPPDRPSTLPTLAYRVVQFLGASSTTSRKMGFNAFLRRVWPRPRGSLRWPSFYVDGRTSSPACGWFVVGHAAYGALQGDSLCRLTLVDRNASGPFTPRMRGSKRSSP